MRIAIVGYGKMGKAVESEAKGRGHEISMIVDHEGENKIEDINPSNTDAVIEFTQPDAALENFQRLLKTGVPVVTGTTGWHGHLEQVRQMTDESGSTFMYSSNFSVGVNILFKLNEQLAKLMNRYEDYDVFIEERHHNQKKDGPSGTANSLASQVLTHLDRKSKVATGELADRPPQAEELSVGFVRAGNIFGQHQVTFISEIDRISIEHEAYNRRGFALGAVIGAEWVHDKKGFYNFSEIFN